MAAPKDRGQLTPWLKQHGYQWVLKAPGGEIVSVAEAIKQIEEDERREDEDAMDYDLFSISDVYYSEGVANTGHVWMGQHDDDTGVFSFFMNTPVNTEEKDGVTRYTLDDGSVFIRHGGLLETEQEWKSSKQS